MSASFSPRSKPLASSSSVTLTLATAPTVYTAISEHLDGGITAQKYCRRGPFLKDLNKKQFDEYSDQCLATIQNIMPEGEDTGDQMSLEQIIGSAQNELDKVSAKWASYGFRAMAINGKNIHDSWKKLSEGSTVSAVDGYLALSVQDPKTISRTWMSCFSKEPVITGCKLLIGRQNTPSHAEAERRIRVFGSKYMDMKNSNVWPSEQDAIDLARSEGFVHCEVITLSEEMMKLPMFVEVQRIDTSRDDDSWEHKAPWE